MIVEPLEYRVSPCGDDTQNTYFLYYINYVLRASVMRPVHAKSLGATVFSCFHFE